MALSGIILPIHPNPLDEESLSSWVTRLALHHHQIPSAFFKAISKMQPDALKQDIDVRCPPCVLQDIAARTGKPLDTVRKTTFEPVLNHLYLHNPESTALPRWIGPAYIRRNTSHHFGLRICPLCLQDAPYIRLLWRCVFLTVCRKHHIRLIDRCDSCGHPKSSRKLFSEHLKSFSKDALCYCHNCGWDYRTGLCSVVGDSEIDAVESAVDLLRLGPQVGGPYESTFSHLVFEGWRLIMNGLMRLARRTATGKGCSLELPAVPAEKNAELEFHSVEAMANLMAISHALLQQWPDRFIEFCRANKLSRYDWVRPRENAPYWLHRILKLELDMTRYSVTAEEIHGAAKWLGKSGKPVKAKDVISTLGAKSRPRVFSVSKIEAPSQGIDVDQLINWLDSNECLGNLGSFVLHRTRSYIGLMLVTSFTHKQLCALKFDRSVLDDTSFTGWAYELGVSDVKSSSFRCAEKWYLAYISERSKIEARYRHMPMLFCSSSAGPLSTSLAIKSLSRVLQFSGALSRSQGNWQYRLFLRQPGLVSRN